MKPLLYPPELLGLKAKSISNIVVIFNINVKLFDATYWSTSSRNAIESLRIPSIICEYTFLVNATEL
jgi:hypothetical protein